jgi:hypothetical protein
MTRKQIMQEYKVDAQGTILSPGQFENEPLYVPYFWDAYLNGMADDDDGTVLTFLVNDEDRAEFPELKDVKVVTLAQTDDGFVGEC